MPALHSADSHLRPPPLTQSDAVTSLLSLGSAASDNPAPIPICSTTSTSSISSSISNGPLLPPSQTTSTIATSLGSSSTANGKHHRRLGSTGKTRRRLSDAREASTRPSTQHSLLSLASLSLSTSPGALSSKPLAPRPASQSTATPSGISISANSNTPVAIPVTSSSSLSETTPRPESFSDPFIKSSSGGSTPIPIITANGKQKKRGIDYKCESCAKIYRHPNCLNKHRWEHTRQWREASKFVLSKHQQVQLLEAAAILSYMGTSSTSLPEDRSEWPSFLSGGSLPKVGPMAINKESKAVSLSVGSHNTIGNGRTTDSMHDPPTRSNPLPLSTSVPIRITASSGYGPRMHDFTLPASTGAGLGIGVVGPGPNHSLTPQARSSVAANGANFPVASNAGGRPFMRPLTPPSGMMMMMMDQPGWTSHIPSSSLRSESSSASRSRSGSLSGSRSRSRSDGSELEPEIEEEEDPDVDVEIMDADADTGEDDSVDKRFGVQDSMTTTTTTIMKGHAVSSRRIEPYTIAADVYPHGSHGSSYGRHGAVQGSGEYGSYANETSGFGGFSNGVYAHGRAGPYATDVTGPSAMRGHGMGEDDEGMSMRPRIMVKSDAEETMRRKAINDTYERRWDGMEMEVDMDMD